MKLSYKLTGKLDTKALLRLSGIAQGETVQSLKRSIAKRRVKGFRLDYEGVTVSFPARDGEPTIEV